MKRAMMMVVAAGLLAGCQTKQISEMSYSEVSALAGEIQNRCAAQGFPFGHPQYKACTDQEVTREITTRQQNQVRRQAFAAALSEAGQNYSRAQQQQRLTTSCTSNRIGNNVYTNCY